MLKGRGEGREFELRRACAMRAIPASISAAAAILIMNFIVLVPPFDDQTRMFFQ